MFPHDFNIGHQCTVHPVTDHEGPEVEQMYSSTLPSTLALGGGGWSTPRPGVDYNVIYSIGFQSFLIFSVLRNDVWLV